MANVILVHASAEPDRTIAAGLRARLEAGGNKVYGEGGLLLNGAEFLIVLWSPSSIEDTPIVVDAQLALQAGKLIQFTIAGLPLEAIPKAVRSVRCHTLSNSQTPITTKMLQAGVAGNM